MKSEQLKKSSNRFLWMVAGLALLIRLAYIVNLDEKWYFYDTVHYDTAAQSLVRGEGFGKSLYFFNKYSNYCLEPIYPLFLAAIYEVFGRNFAVVRILQALINIAQLALLYLISRKLFSERVGRIVLLVSCFYPFFIFISGLLYNTQLFSLLLTLIVFLLLKYKQQKRPGWLVPAALSFALAVLTIPVILPGLVFILAFIFFHDRALQQKMRHAAIFFILVLVGLSPWLIRNYMVFGVISPGRACVGETRPLYRLSIGPRIEKAMAAPLASFASFSVYLRETPAGVRLDCFIDDRYLQTLVPADTLLSPLSDYYVGMIFFGGAPLGVESFHASDRRISAGDTLDQVLLSSRTRPEFLASEGVYLDDTSVHLKALEEGWAYRMIFQQAGRANYFRVSFAEPVTPDQVRRVGMLLYMDRPALDANGYMVWMKPWEIGDIWSIRNGMPRKQLDFNLYYKDAPIYENVSLKDLFLQQPLAFTVPRVSENFVKFWSPFIITDIWNERPSIGWVWQMLSFTVFAPLIAFALVGAFALRRRPWDLYLITFPMWTMSLGYALFFVITRYRIPLDGLLIILASYGACKVSDRLLTKK